MNSSLKQAFLQVATTSPPPIVAGKIFASNVSYSIDGVPVVTNWTTSGDDNDNWMALIRVEHCEHQYVMVVKHAKKDIWYPEIEWSQK